MNNSFGNKANTYNPFYSSPPPKTEEKPIESVAIKIVPNFLPETPSPPKFIE